MYNKLCTINVKALLSYIFLHISLNVSFSLLSLNLLEFSSHSLLRKNSFLDCSGMEIKRKYYKNKLHALGLLSVAELVYTFET